MASIKKRISKSGKVSYQALVRRKGYPLECKTFDSRREAKDWAAGVEGLKRYTHPKGKTIAQKLAEAQAGATGDD